MRSDRWSAWRIDVGTALITGITSTGMRAPHPCRAQRGGDAQRDRGRRHVEPALDTKSAAPPGGDAAAGGKVRGAIAIVLGALAIVALIATTVAVWARAIVFDSDKVANIVGDALAEPEVEAALADYVTEQVFSAVDVDAVVSEVLPDDLDRLEPVIVAGVQTAVDRGVTRALASPEVQEIITRIVERAHSRAMDLLQGDGLSGAISAVDGEVTVNLLPLIGRGLTRLQELGLFDDLEIPDLSADGDPDEQIADLEQATGRDLPDDFGQLVVYQSDQLAERQASLESAQQTVALAKRAVWVLVIVTTVLLAATVLVARNRWRAALWLGLGGVVAMVITRSVVHRVVEEAPEIAAEPGGRAAISAIVDGASTSLLRLAGLILIVAAAVAVLAMFRRQWRRADVVLVGAVLTFIVIVAVLGVSIVSLLLGLVVALLVPVAARHLA